MSDTTNYLTIERHPLAGVLYGAALGLGLSILLVVFAITPFRWLTVLLIIAGGVAIGLLLALVFPASKPTTEGRAAVRPIDALPPIELDLDAAPIGDETTTVPPLASTPAEAEAGHSNPFADIDPGRVGLEVETPAATPGRIDLDDPTSSLPPPTPPPPPAPEPEPDPVFDPNATAKIDLNLDADADALDTENTESAVDPVDAENAVDDAGEADMMHGQDIPGVETIDYTGTLFDDHSNSEHAEGEDSEGAEGEDEPGRD